MNMFSTQLASLQRGSAGRHTAKKTSARSASPFAQELDLLQSAVSKAMAERAGIEGVQKVRKLPDKSLERRKQILELLEQGNRSPIQIAKQLGISRGGANYLLRELSSDNKIISKNSEGRLVYGLKSESDGENL